jgi:hypothetical protein
MIFNPRNAMYISRIDGKLNSDLLVQRDTLINANTFLYFGAGSGGDISCRDLDCSYIRHVFDICTSNGTLHLDGALNTRSVNSVFVNMSGKLHSNIIWSDIEKGAYFSGVPTGELFDAVPPYQYAEYGYNIIESSLDLREVRNMHVDWYSSKNNIDDIFRGIKGQLLYIKSSTNKSIIAVPNKIILSSPSIQLGPYKGILLKYDGLKWIQIQ